MCDTVRVSLPSIWAWCFWTVGHGSTNVWLNATGENSSVDNLTESFTSQVTNAIDRFFPLKHVKIHPTDKPWITPYIKQLIRDRQKAFHSGNMRQWRIYRNKVKFEISIRKKNFYADKTKKLPKNDCKRWWSIVNKLSGRKTKKSNICLHRDGKILSDNDLVTTLNSYFTLVNDDIPSLGLACIQAYLPSSESTPTIYPYQVCKKLSNLNSFKACGPDNIPSWILKEFAHVFAEPVTTIFNSSLVSGLVPSLWKDSFITPIAKTPQPERYLKWHNVYLFNCHPV